MATSTFDKEIIIDDKAADIIIEVLSKPAIPIQGTHNILEKGDKALQWLLSNSKTSSEPKKK